MKLILVPILMLLLLTQSFSKWAVVIGYQLNRDYISKNLCVNQSKPKMHCNGKCQMMKKMAEEEEGATKNDLPKNFKSSIPELVYTDTIESLRIEDGQTSSPDYNEDAPAQNPTAPIASIFHPPALG